MTYVCERCRKPVEDPSGHFCEHCNAFEACQWEDDGESSSSVGPFDPAPQFDDQSTCAGSSIYGQSDFSDGSSEWTFNAAQKENDLSDACGSTQEDMDARDPSEEDLPADEVLRDRGWPLSPLASPGLELSEEALSAHEANDPVEEMSYATMMVEIAFGASVDQTRMPLFAITGHGERVKAFGVQLPTVEKDPVEHWSRFENTVGEQTDSMSPRSGSERLVFGESDMI
mmetsp:Transcript_41042/g.86861  ORF Transcript_41042/g.86861 Transcript_41042/m.86861 type:complete len:228 (+) Transcript_41042:81-764(+)|eukprot:CAMPEP_0204258168 /NCGR_PEP_ID=MMETSP0468-20130131/4842_1 /ASSEMBLY_ACC=CAM_ASM_000383 /TAXON_ID=2969 /ORGANISM="Oxyrrhis marina" /LENGTH=227 /DNA_ID=CAMNT_0051232347 /DNA_START=17 /DNA_END=700 /DNA_ORIENTATION=+